MPEYDIQFTRLNKTDQGLSSLSSLNIPANMPSSLSFSVLSNATPRENDRNRKSSVLPRRSTNTPAQMIREKQSAMIDLAERQKRRTKSSFGDIFTPNVASTPIRTVRNKKTIYDELTGADKPQNELVDSTSSAKASEVRTYHTYNKNTSTPNNDTNRTLTHANEVDDSEPTLVPSAHHDSNDVVIPETQDDEVIPETQEDRIPETQESCTQDALATDPVQVNMYNQIISITVDRVDMGFCNFYFLCVQ